MHMMHTKAKPSVFFDEIRLRCSAGLDIELFGNVSVTWSVQFTVDPSAPWIFHPFRTSYGMTVNVVIAYRASEGKPVA